MIKLNNISVIGIESAIRGMRNPLESWERSDSRHEDCGFHFGDADKALAKKLILAGSDHSKFLRQIFISETITAPLLWWKEMDTYKVGTTANSTSTMHTLHKKPITRSCFAFDDSNPEPKTFDKIIEICEGLRRNSLMAESCDERRAYYRQLIQTLPCSWLQTRTWTANYAVLRNIYFSRKNHKLSEWRDFCRAIEKLPFAEDLITYTGDN